jgi:hypothetical protein
MDFKQVFFFHLQPLILRKAKQLTNKPKKKRKKKGRNKVGQMDFKVIKYPTHQISIFNWLKCIIISWGLAQLQTDSLGF